MVQKRNRVIALLAGCLLIIPLMSCDDSEVIPPTGSTITVGANPATIVLQGGIGRSDIIATVRNELGIPLPGQDVRFSASAGSLVIPGTTDEAENKPIPTDQLGNSTVTLITTTTTTVTATSGNTSGSITTSTVSGDLNTIVLNNDPTSTQCAGSSSTTITNCSQPVCLRAKAQDSSGNGIGGIVIVFELRNNVSIDGNTFEATFTPEQATTNATPGDPDLGVAFTRMVPDASCISQCAGKVCQAEIVATLQGGGFPSTPVQLTINIP